MDERTDSELLSAYRAARDDRVFGAIVERHGGMVYRACLRMTGNAHDAEDAAQAAFLLLAQRPQAVSQSLSGWLHGNAVRTSLNLVRARSRRVKREKEAGKRMEASVQNSAEIAQHHAGLTRELDRALALLPATLREAVVLCHIEGHTQEMAAQLASCPTGTLGWRVMEGLNRLRLILARRGMVLSAGVLTGYMAAEAARAVPQASLAALAKVAIAAHSGKGLIIAKAAQKPLFWAKLKAAATVAAVAATVVAVPMVAQCFSPSQTPVAPAVRAAPAPAPMPAPAVAVAAPEVRKAVPVPPVPLAAPAPEDPTLRYGKVALLRTLNGIPGGAHSIVFSPDGAEFFVGCGRGTIRCYDARTQELKFELTGHADAVFALGIARKGKTLVSSSNDDTVRLWDIQTRTELKRMIGNVDNSRTQGIPGLDVSPDGSRAVTACWDGSVKVWDTATGEEALRLDWRTNGSASAVYSSDGRWLAAASNEGYVQLFDAKSGSRVGPLKQSDASLTGLKFSPDSASLAVADSHGGLRIWSPGADNNMDLGAWRLMKSIETGSGILTLQYSPDGVALLAGNGNRVRVLDAKTLATLAILDGHERDVPSLAVSPDGRTLVTGGYDGMVKLWAIPEAHAVPASTAAAQLPARP